MALTFLSSVQLSRIERKQDEVVRKLDETLVGLLLQEQMDRIESRQGVIEAKQTAILEALSGGMTAAEVEAANKRLAGIAEGLFAIARDV